MQAAVVDYQSETPMHMDQLHRTWLAKPGVTGVTLRPAPESRKKGCTDPYAIVVFVSSEQSVARLRFDSTAPRQQTLMIEGCLVTIPVTFEIIGEVKLDV